MEHSEAQKRIESYADNELAPGAATAFEAHLETCAACREQLGTVMANRRVLAEALDPGAAPAALRARIAGITSGAAARPGLAARQRSVPAWWLQAAALAGVAILSSGATFAVIGRQDEGRVQPLLAARLDYVDGRRAAVMVYGRRKHMVDVFVRPTGDGPPPPKTAERRGYHLIGWREGGFDWWAVSVIDTAELQALRDLLRRPPKGVY